MAKQQVRSTVVYLVGAGASHGCVKFVGSVRGILMRDLNQRLADAVRALVTEEYDGDRRLLTLVNAVIDERTDFEHVITFLDDSPSDLHRRFANSLRAAFESVLRRELDLVRSEVGDKPLKLYSALLDMYRVRGFHEELNAIITTNYDEYIEDAVKRTYGTTVDFGVRVEGHDCDKGSVTLLKLQGSFGWAETWPISSFQGGSTLWIPPGIQKKKERYPFNVLWGLARQVLDCDVLRIVGCRLSGSDWDLISLLLTTRHAGNRAQRFRVEVIDSPAHAWCLQKQYPYLDIRSMLEIEEYDVGSQMVGELMGSAPRRYGSLSLEERAVVLRAAGREENWFGMWLVRMAEALSADPGIESIVFGYRVEARKSVKCCAGWVRMSRYVEHGSRERRTRRFEGAPARAGFAGQGH